jgi:hypothetical protein
MGPINTELFNFLIKQLIVKKGLYYTNGGTRWRSWLRHYAISRKVAGSNPDEIIGFSQFT